MINIEKLAFEIMLAKNAEDEAVARRRDLEDQLRESLKVSDDLDGTQTERHGSATIKITGRINRTIDSDKLQELAAEAGLTDHLRHLFRWKPSIDMKAWKAADENITAPLASAITAKPGRPSVSIVFENE